MTRRYLAAIPAVILSLLNLPIAFADSELTPALAWAVSLLGVLGLVASVALVRRLHWGLPAVAAVGVANLAAAFAALAADQEGAAVGIVLAAAIVAAAVPQLRSTTARTAAMGS